MSERIMSRQLAGAIAMLTEADRRHWRVLARTTDSPWARGVIRAVLAEIEDESPAMVPGSVRWPTEDPDDLIEGLDRLLTGDLENRPETD